MVDYVKRWTERAELPAKNLLGWLELAPSKFHPWRKRYGQPNAHNGRLAAPTSVEAARRVVVSFVAHYIQVRLHSALGYVTPADKLAGLETVIFAERDRKLEEARQRRRAFRRADMCATPTGEEASRGVQRGGNERPLQEPAQTAELVA